MSMLGNILGTVAAGGTPVGLGYQQWQPLGINPYQQIHLLPHQPQIDWQEYDERAQQRQVMEQLTNSRRNRLTFVWGE